MNIQTVQKNQKTRKKPAHSFLLKSSLALLVSFSTNAFSSDEDDEMADISLEDLLNIEVTVASNFAETELEVGSTVEAIFDSQWRDYGAKNVGEAIGHLPSTMVYPTAWGGSAVAIRGYASNLSVRGIATVLDGIPMNNLRTGSALYEIRGYTLPSFNRIEMIRGPGSALYGSDAFHGVLSLKTYQSEEDNLEFDANFSSEGYKDTSLNFTRIISDGVAFNSSVTAIDQGAQDIPYSYTNPFTATVESSDRDNSYDAYMAIAKLNVEHSDTLKSSYGVYFKGHDSEESISGGRNFTPFSIFINRDITHGSDDLSAFKAALEVNYEDDITLEAKAFHWNIETSNFSDLTTLGQSGQIADGEEENTGIDVILKQPDNAWNTQWTVGLSYKKAEITKGMNTFIDDSGNTLAISEDGLVGFDRNVKSFIFSAKSKFLDDSLQIVYGGRVDEYSDFGNQTTPRVGAIYLPSENQSFKLLYGEAFRAPIASELLGGGLLIGNLDLKPELVETSELIYMYQGDFWKLNLTLFQSDWADGIILLPSEMQGFSEYTNVGQNESDGVEVTYRGSLNNWRWDISASFVSSKAITDSGSADYVAFPEKIYNINFGYHFESNNLDLYVTNRIQQDTKAGPITANVPEPDDLSNYSTTDITLDWQINSNWNIQTGIRNAFDKSNYIPGVWGNENGVLTLGRDFQLSFSYKM